MVHETWGEARVHVGCSVGSRASNSSRRKCSRLPMSIVNRLHVAKGGSKQQFMHLWCTRCVLLAAQQARLQCVAHKHRSQGPSESLMVQGGQANRQGTLESESARHLWYTAGYEYHGRLPAGNKQAGSTGCANGPWMVLRRFRRTFPRPLLPCCPGRVPAGQHVRVGNASLPAAGGTNAGGTNAGGANVHKFMQKASTSGGEAGMGEASSSMATRGG